MPGRVYTAQERGFETVGHVGVAVTTVEEGQQHVGLLHRDESNQEVAMLHLAFHCRLRNDQPEPTYAWVDPAVHSARARQVAAVCRKVWRSNGEQIPFAFSAPSDCFDGETGAFLLGPTRIGLTCASFVLAIFHAAGLPLVDYGTWPAAGERDVAWQLHAISMLREHGASEEHVRAVEAEVGAVRYRPEQVAGGAACDALPASFDDAERLAGEVMQVLSTNGLRTG
jgi:hypothetical protein